jgi:hypothetical protein
MERPFKLHNAVLLMALSAAYPLQAHALAGTAQFTAGEVNLRQADGRLTALSRGGDIESGHAIVTGNNGRAQVRFSDGGMVSLQPNTEFRIANYVDQNNPREDRFLVDLLRGSMRAITGLIGKRNRDNYKLTTTTATIGIRGSGFKVGYNPDGSVGITSELDKIEVCNQSGCIGMVAGESVVVQSNSAPPVRTSQQAKVDTPPTESEPTVVGDTVNGEGKASVVAAVAPPTASKPPGSPSNEQPPPATGPDNTGTFNTLQLVANYNASTSGSYFAAAAPSDSSTVDAGKLQSFSNANASYETEGVAYSGSLGTISGGDFIGWGLWTNGTKTDNPGGAVSSVDSLHYVVGIPTPASQMPTAGSVTFNLVGSTAPTLYTGASGTLNSATFSADFSISKASADLVTSFGTVSSASLNISGAGFADTAGTIKGFFSGPNATRAGLVYQGFSGVNYGYFSGAAVFQAQ